MVEDMDGEWSEKESVKLLLLLPTPQESEVKSVMAKSSEDLFSKRHFHWTNKVSNEDEEEHAPTLKPSSKTGHEDEKKEKDKEPERVAAPAASVLGQRRKLQAIAVSRVRSVLAAFSRSRSHFPPGLGSRVIGTLFGHRRGHVHFAFQKEPNSPPAFLVELATPISGLVREMASGLVRIALECDKLEDAKKASTAAVAARGRRLLEEPRWRTYCNGKKCGFAARRDCGPKDWRILKAVEPISMGAGVLPGDGSEGDGDGDGDGEVMYMRAKFERVVGCRDSEAFYMMNPDRNGAPELSIYLLRV